MNEPIKFGSVCSGIEAASVAWMPLGWKAAWLAEIEPFPCAVLAHHYPDVPNLGDMTTIADRIRSGEVEAPDVFCGGTPCQSFSLAGLRKSLDDARGNLSLTFCEIANAIDSVRSVRGEPPAIVFWENVPGVLNTRDNAFGSFLAGLAGESESLEPPRGKWTNAGVVFGPQRAVAWRVLDAQYFGVAQRRRRVFVVASARKGFDPAAVLFESEGVRRDTAPRREAGEVAPATPARSLGGGGLDTTFGTKQGLEDQHMNAGCPVYGIPGNWIGRQPENGGNATAPMLDISPCLTSTDRHGVAAPALVQQPIITMAHGQGGAEIGFDCGPTLTCNHEAPIAAIPTTTHALRGEGFDASEDGTGRGTPLVPHVVGPLACNTGPNGHDAGNFACNQAVDAGHVLPVAFAENSRGEMRLEGGDGQRTGALSTGGGKPGQGVPMICFPATLSGAQHASAEDVCPALGAANPTAVAFNFHKSGNEASSLGVSVERVDCLRAFEKSPMAVQPAAGMAVRRLLPEECEKLQGFEPGYTAIPWRNKPADQCPDGPRYKALGNSWAVPVVSWIGRRIQHEIAT